MGQQPSKKMGRTRSKEISRTDSMASDGPAPPAAGSLVIPSQQQQAPASPRSAPLNMAGTGTPAKVSGKGASAGAGAAGLKAGDAAAGAAISGRGRSPPPAAPADLPDTGEQTASSLGGAGSPPIPTTQTILANPPGSGSGLLGSGFRSSSPPPSALVGSELSPRTSRSSPPSTSGPSLSTMSVGSSSGPSPGPIKALDIDNMISRLLEAGYSGKVTKTPPLKNAEITSVCMAAREVFLSQPTLIELSPPVKIVGDVHGQVGGRARLAESIH